METDAFAHAQRAVEAALRSTGDPIVITGARGVGKSLLLRSLWQHPPRGFAAIFVPTAEDPAAPASIAARILAATRSGAVNDAEAGLARLMRTQSLRGLRPMLLVDDLDAMPLAALSELIAITEGSRVEVSVVAAGVPGPGLDAALGTLGKPAQRIELDDERPSSVSESVMQPPMAEPPDESAKSEPAATPSAPAPVPAARIAPADPSPVPTARIETPAPAPAARIGPVPASPPAPPAPAERPATPTTTLVSPRFAASAPPAPEPVLGRAPAPELPRRAPRVHSTPKRARTGAPPELSRRRARDRRVARTFLISLAGIAALVVLYDRVPAVSSWWGEDVVAQEAEARRWIASAVAESSTYPERALAWLDGLATTTAGQAERVAGWIDRALANAPPEEPVVASAEPAAEPVAPAPVGAPPVVEDPVVEPPPVAAPPPIRVAINSVPWAEVEVDGVGAGSTPLMIDMSPGKHRVRVKMADGRVLQREFVAGRGRDRLVFR